MPLFYSPSTKGFYDTEINTAIPEDGIPVSAEKRAALLAQQTQGAAIGQDADGNIINLPSKRPSKNAAAAASIMLQLADIDNKKIRALTDAILTGDKTRLSQLEQAAVLLRPHIIPGG